MRERYPHGSLDRYESRGATLRLGRRGAEFDAQIPDFDLGIVLEILFSLVYNIV